MARPLRLGARVTLLSAALCIGTPPAVMAAGPFSAAAAARAAPNEAAPRLLLLEALAAGGSDEGVQDLTQNIIAVFRASRGKPNPAAVRAMAQAAEAVRAFALLKGTALRPDVAAWLFGSEDRLHEVAAVLSPFDRKDRVAAILAGLYDHDPEGRDRFFNLILALALVWDEPRPPLHGQMGPEPPMGSHPEVAELYDYFRDQYAKGEAKFPYANLNVEALMFVVDTPVPLSELQWARRRVRGSRATWDRKFSDIHYDHPRMRDMVFSWPHGPYTLASIQEHGGICTDQAYFATLTARASGIPAVFFSGAGRRGSHAWFAYMEAEDKWRLDVGRYLYDKYATGNAVDPQTNRKMTDHDIEYACERSLKNTRFDVACQLAAIAEVLLAAGDFAAARQCAQESRTLVKKYERPWDIEEEAWEKEGNLKAAADLLAKKAQAFSRYADIQTDARQRQAKLMQAMGQEKAAGQLIRQQAKRVEGQRDDLAQRLRAEQAKDVAGTGGADKSRKTMERLMEDQVREGSKVVSLIEEYLDMTAESGQTHEAARFLSRYIPRLRQQYPDTPMNQDVFLNLLLRAYENDGDESKARNVQRDLDKLNRKRR